MMSFQLMESIYHVFFELVRAGLFPERELKGSKVHVFKDVNWDEVDRLAEEQSVVGLVAAGIEKVQEVQGYKSLSIPKEWNLQFIGRILQIEQQNRDMNMFLAGLIDKLGKADIYALLVKGQGVAQCYEKPLWRACGDIDFYLYKESYRAAREFLTPLANHVDKENKKRLHLGMTIDSWVVELHGTLHSDYSRRVNDGLDEIHNSVFCEGKVRSWDNDGVTVFMPSADNDVIIVFTHILQHFFVEGIGLRQICDWCRLLWTYQEQIDKNVLERRLRTMDLIPKWKAFAALAVDYLGMPEDAMPFYDSAKCWHKKGERIVDLILETGTFGHNRDMSYKEKDSFVVRLAKSFKRRTKDAYHQFMIFPSDAMRMWWKMFVLGMKVAMRGDR